MSHHNAFTRIDAVDPAVLVLDLALLLGAALLPWPAALVLLVVPAAFSIVSVRTRAAPAV